MAERSLNTIINDGLFKTSTDGIVGNKYVTIVDGQVVYQDIITDKSYGESSVTSNITPIALTVSDLNVTSTYVSTAALPWLNKGENVILTTPGLLEITEAGTYEVSMWASCYISGPSTKTDIAFRFSTDGAVTGLSTRKVTRTSDFTGDTSTITASGIVENLIIGESLSLFVAATKDCNLYIVDAGLTIKKI
jgi:hypothetical protein